MITPSDIENWILLKKQAADAVKAERDLRIKICQELLQGKEPGTHHIFVGDYRLNATRKLNYKLDQDAVYDLYNQGLLTAEEENLLRLKFELNLRDYKKAPESVVERINDYITTTDAMPSLDLE